MLEMKLCHEACAAVEAAESVASGLVVVFDAAEACLGVVVTAIFGVFPRPLSWIPCLAMPKVPFCQTDSK